ncbi:MAG: cupin domain-containing protein [Ornithinibacter sp.]
MTPRLLSEDLTAMTLVNERLAAEEVVEGTPGAGALTLAALGGVEVGVWEMTEGSARDTEVDEVFVVLSGRGTVTFEDGESITLVPGVAVRLRSGDRTLWSISETLRKVWVV